MSYSPTIGRWMERDPIGYDDGMNPYQFVGSNPVNKVDPLGLSELDASEYAEYLRGLIDAGTVNPDKLFQKLVQHYLDSDPENDWFWDCQDDMEELFTAMRNVLSFNPAHPNGSPNETADEKRLRKVRDFVENVKFDPTKGILVKDPTRPNQDGQFGSQYDKLMHLLAGAGIASNVGETWGDAAGFWTEVGDAIKNLFGSSGGGFDGADLDWTQIGASLENDFDTSECNCRALAKKFASGEYRLSRPDQYYTER